MSIMQLMIALSPRTQPRSPIDTRVIISAYQAEKISDDHLCM